MEVSGQLLTQTRDKGVITRQMAGCTSMCRGKSNCFYLEWNPGTTTSFKTNTWYSLSYSPIFFVNTVSWNVCLNKSEQIFPVHATENNEHSTVFQLQYECLFALQAFSENLYQIIKEGKLLLSYLSKNSDRKWYPWQERKSSSNVCETSLESFKKQKTATNISTISRGDSSWTRCMLSMQRATHPLSANKTKGENERKQKTLCYGYKHKDKNRCMEITKEETKFLRSIKKYIRSEDFKPGH